MCCAVPRGGGAHLWRLTMKQYRLLVTLLVAVGACLLFGQGTKERSAVQKFLGKWTIHYLPDGREALDYPEKKQPLPWSAKTTNTPSLGRLEIVLEDGKLSYDGFTAQVFSGTND